MRDTLTMDAPVAPTNSMAKRATVASTVGSALEWIDFTAYGAVAATVFPKIFFSQMDPNMGILAAFATSGSAFSRARSAGSSSERWVTASGARTSCSIRCRSWALRRS